MVDTFHRKGQVVMNDKSGRENGRKTASDETASKNLDAGFDVLKPFAKALK